ncbi:MAG: hypothetical protein Q7T86_17395 [Hyphomicrobiaceae bacterium]|nr:hypothetical protein [Hyphomicrobiaceae bacterium]
MLETIFERIMSHRILRRAWLTALAGICLASGPAWTALAAVALVAAVTELLEGIPWK